MLCPHDSCHASLHPFRIGSLVLFGVCRVRVAGNAGPFPHHFTQNLIPNAFRVTVQ